MPSMLRSVPSCAALRPDEEEDEAKEEEEVARAWGTPQGRAWGGGYIGKGAGGGGGLTPLQPMIR